MIRFALLGLIALACNVGSLSKDPTTPDPSWPADPPDDPVFAAAGGSGSACAKAIENTKRLGCGFIADDPAKWCATLTAAQVKCLTSANACLASRRCTDSTR